MSEQYPLLYDEVSEEECSSPRFRRQLHMSRVRAKNHVKGAAAIIKRWPGHWTILLNYWWIGISMLALTTYILYSCVFSYVMLQSTNNLQNTPISVKTSKFSATKSLQPKVFMHIFADDKQEVNLNNYLPYIEIITNKYKQFQYELLIVINDTNAETKNLNDKENNDIALNMLWNGNFYDRKNLTSTNNININYVTLSKYLNDSPLKKHWKSAPHQFIKFLVRSVSVWEKGGIAFDPIVLTPQSSNAVYIDKVYNILKKFKTRKVKTSPKSPKQLFYSKKIGKSKLKPNNIRDIIDALENENTIEKSFQELAEAETKDNLTVAFRRKLLSVPDSGQEVGLKLLRFKELPNVKSNDSLILHNDISNKDDQLDSSSKLNLLPMFLEYLFHNKEANHPKVTKSYQVPKQIDNELKSSQMGDFLNASKNDYKPIVISAKAVLDNETTLDSVIEKEVENVFEVTIDLKGNIIATDTACHAFIGSMFINANHHDQTETVTDFIIKELSIFCKGLFASCKGIDVILL